MQTGRSTCPNVAKTMQNNRFQFQTLANTRHMTSATRKEIPNLHPKPSSQDWRRGATHEAGDSDASSSFSRLPDGACVGPGLPWATRRCHPTGLEVMDNRNRWCSYMGVYQNLLLSILVGWTSIYHLLWCSLGYHSFDPWPYETPRKIGDVEPCHVKDYQRVSPVKHWRIGGTWHWWRVR